MNSTYIIDANHTYMLLGNVLWLKVFYHNSTFGDYFSVGNEEEALNSHTKSKFSILGTVDKSFLINNKYEFLYEVPGVKGYNRWRQSMLPKDTNLSITNEQIGYKPVKISWSYNFGGLRKCKHSCSIYCCTIIIDHWWYPIGNNIHNGKQNTIPAIDGLRYDGYEVALWIRVPPNKGVDGLKITCNMQKRAYHIVSYVILLILS